MYVDRAGTLAVAIKDKHFFGKGVIDDPVLISGGQTDRFEDLEGRKIYHHHCLPPAIRNKALIHFIYDRDPMDAFKSFHHADRLICGKINDVEFSPMRCEQMMIDLVDGYIIVSAIAGDRYLFIKDILLRPCVKK